MKPKITYTITDEAPALATQSFLPVVKAFAAAAGIEVETKDISLANRILAAFSEYLIENQKCEDALSQLGKAVNESDANIIKLPNISASVPQIKSVVKELQEKGYAIPGYPENPKTDAQIAIKAKYDKVKGSAVNPVLREGNSDRRAPAAVKKYAMKNPHSMGEWSSDSKSYVASMTQGDFYGSEKSVEIQKDCSVKIRLVSDSGDNVILKGDTPLLTGEVIDAAIMSRQELRSFLEGVIADAKEQDILFSVHLKATMMKVSDPVIFGHAVSVFFKAIFDKHENIFNQLGINPNNGFGDVVTKIQSLPSDQQDVILADLQACYQVQPDLAMVNSDLGITNLHVPSDIIIDASMPAAIRTSGKMWGPDGTLRDMVAVIPDRAYAGVYQETLDFCKKHGAFDPTKMGTVANVGLMAQKAEEYGSHDKTFEIASRGRVEIVDDSGAVLLEQPVEKGDIFRMCQAKHAPILNWIELAVERARLSNTPAIFWLDEKRAHDRALIEKVNQYLPQLDTKGLDISILSPVEATRYSLERIIKGEDTISVTGNVLRDYLTDLFPIMELGTSAKMLSIVPLMNGGGLFETGAGGSAPKHVQQFLKEGHLRWDSLGEFLALAESFDHLSRKFNITSASVLADTLNEATEKFLDQKKSPSRKVNELDNRGSHFYLTTYWAEALSTQQKDKKLQALFLPIFNELTEKETQIISDLNSAQGKPVDLGGYYLPDAKLLNAAMRPSETFNSILESI